MTRADIFFYEAWYCAGFAADFTHELTGRTFLDEPVCLYRAQDGGVVAISDVCPHRFAPLHEGKLHGDRVSCPYHGLEFDREGHCVHNPHGTGKIPLRSTIRKYPTAERDGFVWIWMGEADAADPANIPDLHLIRDEDQPGVTGYSLTPAEYRLIIDNLLDLNHAPYLHGGTLSPVGTTRETTSERGDLSAASNYLMRSIRTPVSQQRWYDEPTGDYHVSMEWYAPATLLQAIAMTGEGAPKESGAVTRGAHLLTPRDATSTHYFWIMTRNRCIDDPEADQHLKRIIDNAFQTEDGPMLQACQANMKGRNFEDMRPIFLETDAAPGHARSVLARLLSTQDRAVRNGRAKGANA